MGEVLSINKKIALIMFGLISILVFCSCNEIERIKEGGTSLTEDKQADLRMEQIVSALKEKDKEVLKSLFSKRAIDETEDFDNDVVYLFELVQGDVSSWERDGKSSDGLYEHGKKSLTLRFAFNYTTDEESYRFFVIDNYIDTIDPDNQGLYMLELIKFVDQKDLEAWQDRIRAGIYVH